MAKLGGFGNVQEVGGSGGGSATDLTLGSDARGMIARREVATWEGYQAKTSGQILVGDGTDIVSVPVSGDATLSSAGAITLVNPNRLYIAQKTLNKNGAGVDGAILGNGAGALANAAGVTLVTGVASLRIQVERLVVNFTFVTAAYTGGGNLTVRYATDLIDCTSTLGAASSLTAANDTCNIMVPANSQFTTAKDLGIGRDVFLKSAASFTDPGTAAGTAVITVYYRFVVA